MDFSKLSATERNAAIAAAVVVVSSLISIATAWGPLMVIPLLAGVAALAVVFGPQIMPAVRMPGSRGSLLALVGAVAALVWIVVALDWIDYIPGNLFNLDTLQFLAGLVAAIALTWLGWQLLQAEGGTFQLGMSGASTAAAPAATADASTSAPAAAAQSGSEPAQSAAPPESPMSDDEERSPA